MFVIFISGLSFFSFSGGFGHGGFSVINKLVINSDQVFELSSLWIESIFKMCGSDSKSNSSISDFFIEIVF